MTTKIIQEIVEVSGKPEVMATDERERYIHLMEAMRYNDVPFLKHVLLESEWLELDLEDQINIAEAWVCEFVINGEQP